MRGMSGNAILAILAALAIAAALTRLHSQYQGVDIARQKLGGTSATIYRPASGPLGPVIVIAHGFAGSGTLMQSFALTFARNGYVAVTFDFPGHGRNPEPLTGDLQSVEGATLALVASLTGVAADARKLGDGRLAVLGHSMASDIVVRFAEAHPEVAATIAVSMFSPAVTADAPRNLLVIVGDWEGFLKSEALRAVGLATAPAPAEPGVTYGDPAAGTGRRVAFSPHVEHASVLFSHASMREALGWVDQTFGVKRTQPPQLDARGPWILLLLAGSVGLARPAFSFLPRVAAPPVGAGLPWRRALPAIVAPAIATPFLLRFAPTHFLPVLVADYLAAHFALYGLLTALALASTRGAARLAPPPRKVAAAAFAVAAYSFLALDLPINIYFTSFVPGPERAPIIAALAVGALFYFLSDEWLTRGPGAARGAYPASKIAFLVSLAIAVALDFERLFFLTLIVPIIGLFFIIHGLFSAWAYRATGHPFVAGAANAIAAAWAIGVVFPLVAG